MAITRSQQAKQMLQDGGRIGLFLGGNLEGGYSESRKDSGGKQTTVSFGGGDGDGGGSAATNVKVPPKKPKKTKDNTLINKFVPPSVAILSGLGEGIANSRLGRFLNTKARKDDYLKNLQITNPELYQETIDDLEKLGYYNSDPVEYFGPKGKQEGPMAPARDIEKFPDLFEDQAKSILNTVRNNPDGSIGTLYDDYLDSRKIPDNSGDGPQQDPCKGPNPPAYCFVGIRSAEVAAKPVEEKSPFEILNLRTRFADGGMPENPAVEGGIMDIESGRQMYFLGKLVKKATRAVKKIVKSPIGKAALFAAPFMFPGAREGIAKFLFKSPMAKGSGFGGFMEMLKGGMTGGGKFALGTGLTLSPFLFGNEEEEQSKLTNYGADIDDPKTIMANYPKYLNLRNRFAEGGEAEPVAKKTMPLIDMDGKEMDLRADGGFVPIGRMERADDVPARLSKNEFVFTADAVRNAGEGDIDKGAEVMYNMMKNLESGGEVSEESQGLDGARDMFQTSQRLEEVL